MSTIYPPNLLKTIILESQEEDLPSLYPRDLQVELDASKPVIISGVRRAGKSSYLTLIQQELLSSRGVARENICSINFVDERIRPLRTELLTEIESSYRELYPDSDTAEVYWFFDEIHIVPEWEYFVDRLARKCQNKIFISGSSAKLASGEIASSLRGRPLVYELFPLSFKEILGINELSVTPPATRLIPRIKKLAQQYVTDGGFPESLQTSIQLRHRIHSEYYRAILLRDIVERHEPKNPRLVEVVLKELTSQIGLLTSFSRIERRLEAAGTKTSLSTVLDYFDWAKEAYYLYQIELFSGSLQKRRVNPVKLYAVDSGLVNSVSASLNQNIGRLFENVIYSHLRRESRDIFYYKTRSNYEVDFVMVSGRSKRLVQVAYDLSDPDTRFREMRALEEGMQELEVKQAVLVNNNLDEVINTKAGDIVIVPAWRYLGAHAIA